MKLVREKEIWIELVESIALVSGFNLIQLLPRSDIYTTHKTHDTFFVAQRVCEGNFGGGSLESF